jgi:ABC-2 type transport system permease protein
MRPDLGKAWAIARNITRAGSRDPRLLFFAIAMPLLIIVLVGSLFGGSATRVPLGVVEQDASASASALVAGLRASPNVKVKTYGSISALRREVRRGRMTAGLIVTPTYGTARDLVLVTQKGRVETNVLRAAVEEVSARDGAAPADGPGVRMSVVGSHGGTRTPTAFAYTSASNLVLFTFVNTLAVGGMLAATRRLGLVRRMLATPTSPATIVVGEATGRFLIALAQSVGLVAIGSLIFGVRWGDPLAMAIVVVVFAVVSTAAGLVFGTMLTTEEQAVPLAAPIGIALAMLGGCFWSLEDVSPALRMAGHLTPHAWAMDALVVLLYGGAGVGSIARPILVLTAFALALLVVAARNMRRMVVA